MRCSILRLENYLLVDAPELTYKESPRSRQGFYAPSSSLHDFLVVQPTEVPYLAEARTRTDARVIQLCPKDGYEMSSNEYGKACSEGL
jgi:hypothetical protein